MSLFFTILLNSLIKDVFTCFAGFWVISYYLKRVFNQGISEKNRKLLDIKISKWWEKSQSLQPNQKFTLIFNSIKNLFYKNDKANLLNIAFYSFCFTFLALTAGYLVDCVATYLSVFWHYPIDLAKNIYVVDLKNNSSERPMSSTELQDFLSKEKTTFYYSLVWFCGFAAMLLLFYRLFKKNFSPSVLYQIFPCHLIFIFLIKAITILADYIGGRWDHIDTGTIYSIFLNMGLLIAFLKSKLHIKNILECGITMSIIIIINLFLEPTYETLDYKAIFLVDGLLNRFVSFYLINFIFDYLSTKILFSHIYIKNTHKYFLLSCLCVCLLNSIVAYLTYTFYIYNMQIIIPGFALSSVRDMSFFDYLKSTTSYAYFSTDYFTLFYAFATFLPFVITAAYTILLFLMLWIRKISSNFLLVIYSFSDPKEKITASIIPYYVILIIVTFIAFIYLSFEDVSRIFQK